MQTSYLRMLCQMLNVLREEQTIRYADQITSTVLTLLRSTQHCLSHRDQVEPHTVTPLKSLRALSITTLTRVFNKFPAHDFAPLRPRVNQIVLDANLPGLPSESLQSCSPLLLFIESWSSHRVSWLDYSCADKTVLSYVISLLDGKGVTNSVISKVFSIVSTLLENAGQGVTLLRPFIQKLVDYIYNSLLSLKKKVPDKKTLKQELHLLAQLSGLITETGDGAHCGALVRCLVHVLQDRIVRRPGDVVNALETVTKLTVHLEDTTLLQECYVMCNRLLGCCNDRFCRSSVCRLMEQTDHPSAGILGKLHAWNPKVVDEPDFDTRLEGYREMGEQVRGEMSGEVGGEVSSEVSGKVSGVKLLTPWINTALYTVFSTDEMALRDSASQSLLLAIQHIPVTSSLYSSIVELLIAPAVQRALSNSSEIFRREAVVLLHKMVQVFPETPPWQHLAPLTDPDPEIDFFNNITHIQTHRRTRAVTKLRGLADDTNPDIVWNYFLPLMYPVFSLKGYTI